MSELDLDFYNQQLTQWGVSMFDVVQSEKYQEWLRQNDSGLDASVAENIITDPYNSYIAMTRPPKKVLQNILKSLGLSIDDKHERQICRHSTFGGHTVYGERYVGVQRTDDNWVNFVKRMTK